MNEWMNRRRFLQSLIRFSATIGVSAVGLGGQGCKDIGSTVVDMIEHSDSITNVWKSGSRSMEEFTPEQEYYIGRSIGAVILKKYPAYPVRGANRYLNLLGQTLARFSDTPYLFAGYHFLLLDSNDINAFATPSGLILITRGMVHCCENEEMLAAVLAHEIAHIQAKHGMSAIKKSRVTKVMTTLAEEGARVFGSDSLAELTDTFEETIDDIVTTMVNKGYSRDFESEADEGAIAILRRTGYPPSALVGMLRSMDKRLVPERGDFAATHPSPESRISSLKLHGKSGSTEYQSPESRVRRFGSALKDV